MGRGGGYALSVVLAATLAGLSCNQTKLTGANATLVAVAPLDFGQVPIRHTRTAKLLLRNNGRAEVHVRAVQVQAPFGVLALASPLTIPSGEQRAIAATFTPSAEGPFQSEAHLVSDADTAAPVDLHGFGANIQVAPDPATLDFGAVDLDSSKTLPLNLVNTGNVGTQVTALGIDGADAALFSAAAAPVLVPARGVAALQVTFHPTHLGSSAATLHLSPCDGCDTIPVSLVGSARASAIDIQPEQIDFGSVPEGSDVAKLVTISNRGAQPIDVTQIFVTAQSDPDFTVAAAGFNLPPGTSQSATVHFMPSSGGAKTGTLRVLSTDPRSPRVDVPLRGGGQAMNTLVDPRTIDFGQVAVGMSARQVVTVFNLSPAADLNVLSAQVTQGASFAGGIAAPARIGPGDHLSIPVSYLPTDAVHDQGLLTILTDEAGGTTVAVALQGTGVRLPPCQLAAAPPALAFGTARVGEVRHLAVALIDTGTSDCYLSGVDLTPATDSAFKLTDGAVSSALLHAGWQLTIRVTFAPTANTTYAGALQFFASNPNQPQGQVPLSGAAAPACLTVSPANINFGTVHVGCAPPKRQITATNTCARDIDIASVALGPGDSTEFGIAAGNQGAHVLPMGGQETFTVTYAPTNDGPDSEAVVFTLADGTTIVDSLEGNGVVSPTQTDRFNQSDRPKVDLLFVVDNSGSMTDKQAKLAQNFQTFIQAALAQNIDYHIGVTTTNINPATGGWTQCPGGAQGGEAGRLFPVDNSSPRIITTQTPNAAQVFQYNVTVGTCSWLEQGFEGAYLALTPPLVDHADDPATPLPDDGNLGFLRSDARLSIIVVSDADDQSDQPEGFYEGYFRSLKGNRPGDFVFSGIVTPPNKDQTCPNGEGSGLRYIQMAQDTGGVWENICDADWATPLGNMAQAAFGPATRFPLSATPADPTQITVTVNGQPVTSGWIYDSTSNAVIFTQGSAPVAGSSIAITYPLGC